VLLGLSIIGTTLLTNSAWGANSTAWTNAPGATNGNCSPVRASRICFWEFDSVGWSPAISRHESCPSINFRLFRPLGTESPTVDLYVCHNDTTGHCEQAEGVNRRTGAYGNVTLDSTDWGAIRAAYTKMMVNVTADDTCADCEIIAECGN
jgi:hypothetical protein